jgi:hypothetical protein
MKISGRRMSEQNSAADLNGPTTFHVAGALEGLRDEILELKDGERIKRSIRARRQTKESRIPGEED